MTKKLTPRTETVTMGTHHAGKINVIDRGFETFGPLDQYIATFPTIQSARKALFERHRDSQQQMMGGDNA